MGKIRYVCLSDTHLGEEDSLLTKLVPGSRDIDPLKPSTVMIHLANCLSHLILDKEKLKETERPTLILNGDILEMALCTTNQAAMVFERFIELVQPEKEDRAVPRLP